MTKEPQSLLLPLVIRSNQAVGMPTCLLNTIRHADEMAQTVTDIVLTHQKCYHFKRMLTLPAHYGKCFIT